jgi:hypothetical protein
MNTEARRKASASYKARLIAEGWRQKAFLLSPAAQRRLAELAGIYGSEQAAIEAMLSPSPEGANEQG